MASNIDTSVPVFGNATTASVRQNFAQVQAINISKGRKEGAAWAKNLPAKK